MTPFHLPSGFRVQVFGPAYLDRVLRVDRPLHEGDAPLDQSVDGALSIGEGLSFHDPFGSVLAVTPPEGWPGPTGQVRLSSRLNGGPDGRSLSAVGLSWHDELGGMGAGFAAALGGELVSALGDEGDPTTAAVSGMLDRAGLAHRPIRVSGRAADWTLLVTSGPFGDKLPVGFRGCHAAVGSLAVDPTLAEPCDLRVVASLPNRLAAEALRAPGAGVRVFAPSTRNMTDRAVPVSRFAESVDVLCCNRREWESLDDREQVAWQVALLAVTDGANGSEIRFTTPQGEAGRVRLPAFPRTHPPRDVNRAGEAFAASLVAALISGGWSDGVADESLVRAAAERASAAAALVLDRTAFGFPAPEEVDAAVRAGRVGDATGAGGVRPRYNARGDAGETG